MTKNIVVVALLFATAVFGYFTYNKIADGTLPPVADPVTTDVVAFTLADLDGNLRQFSEWDGKARLVNFWATWCAPCRREIPLLKKTQERHAGNNLQVIGVAVDLVDQVTAYAEEAKFNYPILVGQEDAMAAAEATGIDFIGMPFTMVVTPDGRLIKTHIGEIVEEQITLIIDVFDRMATGELDLDGARSALKSL